MRGGQHRMVDGNREFFFLRNGGDGPVHLERAEYRAPARAACRPLTSARTTSSHEERVAAECARE
jgi:hypothetical protein